MPNEFPDSRSEFQALMEEIDRDLREADVPIHARPIRAHTELIERFPIRRVLLRPGHDPPPDSFRDRDLAEHAYRWYDERYGDRLLIDSGVGRAVVLIRDDPWTLNLPIMYGPHDLVAAPGAESAPEGLRNRSEPATYNVLDSLSDMPQGLKQSLTENECRTVLETFVLAFRCFNEMRPHEERPLVGSARANLDATVEHLTAHPRRQGLAQWSSLQAAEKMLKAFIKAHAGDHPYHHRIGDLADDAYEQGLPRIPPPVIEGIDLLGSDRADVRYGEVDVSLAEAVTAHHESLRLCHHVASPMPHAGGD